jgi:uncharacterized membrane protein (UPF0127 family)
MPRRPASWLTAPGLAMLASVWLSALQADGGRTARDFGVVLLAFEGHELRARLADTPGSRAIGYRYISREQAPPAIYFLYPDERNVTFHMRGVSFPLKTFWLDSDNCILASTFMQPETDDHRPPSPVRAVLEVPADSAWADRLTINDCLTVGG